MGHNKKQIKALFENACRVFHYRKDVLDKDQLSQLNIIIYRLTDLKLKTIDTSAETINDELKLIDQFLKKIGGKIYPKTFWIDNVEVALVALIIVIGIRTFFFQPFIIPTNSMYPTYSGMKEVVHSLEAEAPGFVDKLFNKVRLGSQSYYIKSDYEGFVSVPLFSQSQQSRDARLRGQGFVSFDIVNGKKWFGLLPAKFREYTLYVGNKPLKVRVPLDFSLDSVLLETYFSQYDSFSDLLSYYHKNGLVDFTADKRHRILTQHLAKAQTPIVAFDINLGDALFVDRVSYHFFKPKVGDPFVFKTGSIEVNPSNTQQLGDKYYIKRLSAIENETISIENGALMVGFRMRDEAKAFLSNAMEEGFYAGYQAAGFLSKNQSVTIPEDNYYALGDNSYNSYDSRFWGFVPEKALVGKAVFIYYPFTKRWGIAE